MVLKVTETQDLPDLAMSPSKAKKTRIVRVHVELPSDFESSLSQGRCLLKGVLHCDPDEDDEASESSEDEGGDLQSYSTLLSSCGLSESDSDFEDDASLDDDTPEHARDRRLSRITRGKSEAYANMLQGREDAVRRQSGANNYHSSLPQVTDSALSWIESTWLFEAHHSMPAYLLFVFYCFANMAFYNLVSTVMNLIIANNLSHINKDATHLLFLLVSLATMRCSGYLWMYADPQSYSGIKFDLHNRLRLGYSDAKIFYYLQHHAKTLSSILNMLSFYVGYTCIVHFYIRLTSEIMDGWLNQWYTAVTTVTANATSITETIAMAASSSPELCSGLQSRMEGGFFHQSLAYHLCTTAPEMPIVAIVYDVGLCFVSALALRQLHFNFLESVD